MTDTRTRLDIHPAGTAAKAALHAVGSRLGNYRLDRLIAQGGMGVVYEAHHLRLGSRAAVKLPLNDMADSPELLDLFRREGEALARLEHPNVVRVLDLDEDDLGPYLVLEYLDGETVADRLARTGPLPVAEAVRIVLDIAAALDDVHSHGFVHCDLKPANVFLQHLRRGRDFVKLLDFGISTRAPTPDEDDAPPPSLNGTPSYMAPEQIRGAALDHHADQYSLAVMAYELLTGKKAFLPDGARSLLATLEQTIPHVSQEAWWVPEEVDAVLRHATSPRPEDRYPDIVAFATALGMATNYWELTDSPPSSELPDSGVRSTIPLPDDGIAAVAAAAG